MGAAEGEGKGHVPVLLAEVRPNVRHKLERSGVIAHAGAENVLDTLELALLRAEQLRSSASF